MTDWLSEEESQELLRRLFPNGLGGGDVMEALSPEGWADSPLRLALHPTPEQRYVEMAQMRENLESFRKMGEKRRERTREEKEKTEAGAGQSGQPPPPEPLDPLPDRETFLAEARAQPEEQVESDSEELGRLVGLCLWDVLSDNHDLILPDGRLRHLGSFRATAGIIADFFRGKMPAADGETVEFDWSKRDMDYCEFYLGTCWVGARTDLAPAYRLIFERLKALDYAWQFAFPKLGVARLGNLKNALGSDGPEEWKTYNPSDALAREEEERQKEAEFRRLEENLERIHRESLEEAKRLPPPKTVLAYREVFGHWPAGWPPWE